MTILRRLRLSILSATVLLVALALPRLSDAMADGGLSAMNSPGSETRALAPIIDSIETTGPIDLIVRRAAVPSLVVKAEQRLLDKIRTSQEGRTLSISLAGPVPQQAYRPVRIELGLPALQFLKVAGSGDADLAGFDGERLKLVLSGSGDVAVHASYRNVAAMSSGSGDPLLRGAAADSISLAMSGSGDTRLEGRTRTLTASMKGSGDLRCGDLTGEVVTLALSGSGDAFVNPTRSLTVISSGSGNVMVYGQPAQKVLSRSGSGSITFR